PRPAPLHPGRDHGRTEGAAGPPRRDPDAGRRHGAAGQTDAPHDRKQEEGTGEDMKKPECPGCGGQRRSLRVYLCENCWWLLKPWTREALKRRDNLATARLISLRKIGRASCRAREEREV